MSTGRPEPVRKDYDIFISYKKEDAERIAPTVNFLERLGYRVWIDQRHLHAGAIWHVAITQGLEASRCQVLFISRAAMASEECAKEVSLAKEEARIPVLPVRLEAAELSQLFKYHLKHVQYIDLFPDAESGQRRLAESLAQIGIAPGEPAPAPPPPVRRPARRLPLLAAAGAALAVLAFVVLRAGGGAAPPPAATLPAPAAPAAVAALAAPAPATLGRIAVLYFEDNSRRPELAPLAKGLCDVLIQQIEARGLHQVVERARLEAVLGELRLGASGSIDGDTAARMGRLLGAQRLVLGSYFEVMGRFRIDARIIDVERGSTEAAVGVTGAPEQFMELIDRLAGDLVERHRERSQVAGRALPVVAPGGDLALALELGRGLAACDAGNMDEARRIAETILARLPGCPQAQILRQRCGDAP